MRRPGKLLSLLLAVLMVAALMPFSALAAALPFTDVPQDAWYYPVVKEAYEKGITTGVTRTTFEPNATVTREMFLVMLFRAAGINMEKYHDTFPKVTDDEFHLIWFSDVQKDMWYTDVVCLAKELEITKGVEELRHDGEVVLSLARFGVGEPITREQMATLADRFMDARGHVSLKAAESPAAAFADAAQVSDWAKDAVEAMRLAGILKGDEQSYVNPKAYATRAEAAAVVLRLMDATERVSIVPEGTAWIKIAAQPPFPPKDIEIRDPDAVKDMIRKLDEMPIDTEYGMGHGSGWSYWISFYDQNDQHLGGYKFGEDYIVVNDFWLTQTDPYFLSWIQMFED